MAVSISTQNRVDVSNLYVALFGRAPDGDGLGYWSNMLVSGTTTLAAVADAMFAVQPARAYYPAYYTNSEIVKSFYSNVLGRPVDADALTFWTNKLNAKDATVGSVVTEMLAIVATYTGTDAAGIASAALFAAKADVALTYGLANASVAAASAALAGFATVTASSDAATVAAAAAAAKALLTPVAPVPTAQNVNLTVGIDNLTGTALNDTFNAYVVQNVNGEQTNQLATGDSINGGAGTDTLNATVQMASALNNAPTQAITPTTKSVENANFTALTVNQGALATAETVNINAKNMTGLAQVSSFNSDASLAIYNLTTLTDSGLYADRRNTDSVTIRMDHSGNDIALDKESDLTVLFDNDYLVSGKSSTSSIGYWVEDREAAKATPATPLKKIDATGVVFTLNGVNKTITIDADALKTFLASDGTWAGYTALLQTALTAAKVTDTTLANLSFSLDTNNLRVLGKDSTVLPVAAPAITLTSSVGDVLVPGGFTTKQEFGVTYDVFTEITTGSAISTIQPITSTIQLEKAGRGAEGGDLTVGAMSTNLLNVWDYSTSARKEGVEKFNVTVSGDDTQFSDLASMQSTNNTLTEVNVNWATGSLADLTIGNHNTVGAVPNAAGPSTTDVTSVMNNALKDVRVFTAANNNNVGGVTNDVTVYANISDESVAKYMNRVDNGSNPAFDNANFVYTFGAGNDNLNINISKTNLAASGTTNREDFSFTANTGDGDDTVSTQIGNGTGVGTDAWLINNQIDKNLTINTGAGNDTVKTYGAGTWTVDLGTGNDTIYSDNSGGRAAWVFNAVNTNINDLVSQEAASVTAVNANLTVTFLHLTSTVSIGGSANSTLPVTITDLTVNQAIKAAINSDPVLGKLLLAQDGPGRTLIVTSLIDGAVVNPTDLDIAFSGTALSAAQISLGLTQFSSAVAGYTALTDGFDYGTGRLPAANGTDSVAVTDTTTTGGTGNDVIVLSGTVGPDLAGSSNETVVYGAGFGSDTIVGFDSNWNSVGGVNYANVASAFETITLTFAASDGSPVAQTIVFDGRTVTLSAPATQGVIPGVDVAFQFAQQFGTSANWGTVTHTPNTNTVTLTRLVAGNTTDVTSADFTGSYVAAAATGGGGIVGVATTQGVDAATWGTRSQFVVTFDTPTTAASAAGNFTFDGSTVAYAQGDGSISLAAKLAGATFSNWTATVSAATPNAVTFVAKAPGATAVGVGSNFALGTNTIAGTVVSGLGLANVGTPTQTVVLAGPADYGYDLLDFSALGGSGNAFGTALTLDKSITVAATTTANNNATSVGALFSAANTATQTHVYVAVDTTTNIGTVYSVADAVGASNAVATSQGTIDLADTIWSTLHANNFTGYTGSALVPGAITGTGWAIQPLFTGTPVYTLTPTTATVNEGSAQTFALATTNVPVGTVLNYAITGAGITTADTTIALTGTVTVATGGTASLILTPTLDLALEGTETATVTFTVPGSTTAVATAALTIQDTSVPAGSASTVTVTAGNTAVAPNNATVGTVTYSVTTVATYDYYITGFAAGDKLAFAAGSVLNVNNTSGTDGNIDVTASLGGQTATIHLVGVATATDGAIFNAASFNAATGFGAGSLA